MIKYQGIIQKEDKIQMLDVKSLELLEHYVETFADSKKSPVSKKHYIQINNLQVFDILNLKKWGAKVDLPEEYEYYWTILSELKKCKARHP